jgi:L-ascorbate metabolism protein UlaG (beta-lactamase superfamily)
MIATYHGQLSLKLQMGDTTIAINPISKDSGKKVTRFGSDICLVSANLDICNGTDQVENAGRAPFVIKGPGEYEVKGITFKGVETKFKWKAENDSSEKINTSYLFVFDNIKICVLGVVNEKLSAELRDAISNCDLLILPVCEGTFLSAHDAVVVANNLEPKMVIPVGFDDKTLPIFLKEAGAVGLQAIEKLTIKKKDLEGKEGVIVTLQEI